MSFIIEMRRFFVKNILFVIAVNVLVKPIWSLFIDRVVQIRVGEKIYGTYAPLWSLSIIFSVILDFGITNYNTRTIAQNPDSLPEIFPSMFSARLVFTFIYMALAYLWGMLLGYRGWELSLLIGVLLIQALNAMVAFIRSNIVALHKFKTDGIISVTDKLLMIIICGFLLYWPATAHRFKIEWFVLTQIACYFIAAVVGYVIIRRIGRVRLRFSFDRKVIFGIVKQSFPYALLIFQMSVYNRVDVMLIERMCPDGKVQAGIWAAAFRLLDQTNMFGLMFATMLLPMFGRMLAHKENVQPMVKLSVNMMLPLSVIVAVAGVFYSAPIMHLLYHNGSMANPEYNVVFAWLMASFPAWCLMYVYSTLLTANGSMRIMNMVAFGGVVVNIVLNLYFIPHYEAVAGAVISFFTQTAMSLGFMYFAARMAGLPFNARWALSHIGYMALVVALAYGVVHLLTGASWVVQLFIFGAICMLLMFVFRFISIKSIRQLAGKKLGVG